MGSSYSEANPTLKKTEASKYYHIKWQPHDRGMVKLNFDGFVKDDTSASFGFVIRDSLGNPIFAATKITGKSKVLIAKAMTL